MIFIANEFDLTVPNLIGPLILLTGFAICVSVGVWFAMAKWREHRAQTVCRKCGYPIGPEAVPCARCGASP